jgi:hypothetical protein
MKGAYIRIWKEVIIICFKVLFQNPSTKTNGTSAMIANKLAKIQTQYLPVASQCCHYICLLRKVPYHWTRSSGGNTTPK